MKPGFVSEVLVVPPLYFDVVDSYNTRMRPNDPFGKPDKDKTIAQWSRMIGVLHNDLHIKTIPIDPVEGLYDMAFACDPGLWVDDLFIAGNFHVPQRNPEVASFEKWFRAQGCKIARMPEGTFFEGGDCVMVGNTAIVGFGTTRTDKRGIAALKDILEPRGIKVIPIRRVTAEFYHLNSVLTYYPSAHAIAWFPEAFEMETWKKLADAVPEARLITLGRNEVSRDHPAFGGEELYSYCLNSIENGRKVLMPYCSPGHAETLKHLGLEPIVPEDGSSSEFERSGGSYRCLTMIHNVVS